MQTQPLSSTREASPRPSPVEIWQQLLNHLLDRHYGLTLNETPFGNDGVILEHIDAGDSLVDALNEMAEDSNLERTDNRGKSLMLSSPLLTPADILSAQNTVGLAGNRAPLIINARSSSGS
ncbi:TA system toxin CbtA family protein [Enterobacter asburiae]|uniref:TA system toxin CbtA family protein n=1 Tax=Enterobacter asburiae TaxID=61645 RepID=UPI003BD8C3E2